MGHHRPVDPADPAALRGRAPVLLTSESLAPCLGFLCVCIVVGHLTGYLPLLLFRITYVAIVVAHNSSAFRKFKVMCPLDRISFLGFHKFLAKLDGLKTLWVSGILGEIAQNFSNICLDYSKHF